MNRLLLLLSFVCLACHARGQARGTIAVPGFDDQYSTLVRQLEAGSLNVDYRAFRESFIASEQFLVAAKKSKEQEQLTKQLYAQLQDQQYQDVLTTTQRLLSINYTNLLAHKILRQTYKIVGDTASASKYKRIQFGLLNSIVQNGNGKTCATAWPVTQLDEEYFILQVLGLELIRQSTDHAGGLCDKMEVRTETGETQTYFFETSQIFDGYRRMGLKEAGPAASWPRGLHCRPGQ